MANSQPLSRSSRQVHQITLESLDKGAVGRPLALVAAGAPQHEGTSFMSGDSQLGHQATFPDSGLAPDKHRPAGAHDGRFDIAHQKLHQSVAPDEGGGRIARNGTWQGWTPVLGLAGGDHSLVTGNGALLGGDFAIEALGFRLGIDTNFTP